VEAPASTPHEQQPFVLMDESPAWLLFPSIPAESGAEPPIHRGAYRPRTLPLPAEADEAAYGEVYAVLRRTRLFRSITDKELHAVLALGRMLEFPRYSLLVREGTSSASCYVVLSGTLLALSSKQPSGAHLRAGDTFGETALVADSLREHTVSALSTSRVLMLERGVVDPEGEAWRRPEVTTALQATAEWAELRHMVITNMLEGLSFFGSLVASRRVALAALMTLTTHEGGSVVFREGDQANKFYVVADGAIEIHKAGGRFSGSRVVSMITQASDRPWLGEVALWLRKPRAGSALVVSETCHLLVVDEINFDQFLSLVPDFRPYLNKNHKQASVVSTKKGLMSLEAATASEEESKKTTTVVGQWQSGGRLGGRNQGDMAERSIFAERWERLVTSLLYMPSESNGLARSSGRGPHSTVSFRTADYKW